MGERTIRIIVSIFLISLGILVLLSNLDILPWDITTLQAFWLVVFGAGGLVFLAVFFSNRENWWAVIPGFTLLGLAVVAGDLIPGRWGELGGAVFLGMIGLSFWVIYFTQREHWWSVIPAGVLTTLAAVAASALMLDGIATGGVFFLGLALTFLLVYLRPLDGDRMRWALWPAGILGVMGVFLLIGMGELARFVWPSVLIVLGGFVLLRALRK